jgi:hypothetical protein
MARFPRLAYACMHAKSQPFSAVLIFSDESKHIILQIETPPSPQKKVSHGQPPLIPATSTRSQENGRAGVLVCMSCSVPSFRHATGMCAWGGGGGGGGGGRGGGAAPRDMRCKAHALGVAVKFQL